MGVSSAKQATNHRTIRSCQASGKLGGAGLTTVQVPEASCTPTSKLSASEGRLSREMAGEVPEILDPAIAFAGDWTGAWARAEPCAGRLGAGGCRMGGPYMGGRKTPAGDTGRGGLACKVCSSTRRNGSDTWYRSNRTCSSGRCSAAARAVRKMELLMR